LSLIGQKRETAILSFLCCSNVAGGGGGWGGGGGGVRDLAAIMMFQPRRLKMLKRRYEQLLRISLQVSQWLLKVATTCGIVKCCASLSGQSPCASHRSSSAACLGSEHVQAGECHTYYVIGQS
jgi:hypothetical protein